MSIPEQKASVAPPSPLVKPSDLLWRYMFVYLFLIVPYGATSILLQSGVVTTSASVWTNMVPHLCKIETGFNKQSLLYKPSVCVCVFFYHNIYLFFLHSNQGDGQTHSVRGRKRTSFILFSYKYQWNLIHIRVVVVSCKFCWIRNHSDGKYILTIYFGRIYLSALPTLPMRWT